MDAAAAAANQTGPLLQNHDLSPWYRYTGWNLVPDTWNHDDIKAALSRDVMAAEKDAVTAIDTYFNETSTLLRKAQYPK